MLRMLAIQNNNLIPITMEDLQKIPGGFILSIDASTTSTGMTLLTIQGIPLVTMRFTPDVKGDPIRYKVMFKAMLARLMVDYTPLGQIFYEEPILEYANNVKALFGLRTTVPEILIEQELILKGRIKFYETPNQLWKKLFLHPTPIPSGTEAQKEAVANKLKEMFEWAKDPRISEDECDSCGLGIASSSRSIFGEADSMVAKKKARPFQYEMHLIGANVDSDAIDELAENLDKWKVPKKIREESLKLMQIDGRGLFEKKVYQLMGDEDRILILKFKSKSYQNIVYCSEIAETSNDFDYIYAVIWRKSRKAKKG